MEARIIGWTASNNPMQLRITVGVEPLGGPKTYIWKYGGSHYSRWDWFYENGEQEVIGDDARSLLTLLVNDYDTLNRLRDYYRIPLVEVYE